MPPNVKLTHVHRVSEKSVLLTAKEGATLDFGTINSCPPAHRGLVQQNGLIAKVWLSISEKGLSAQEQKSIFVDGAGTVPIWKEALTLSGLTTADTAFQPTSATQIPWPILREAEYKERVVFAQARQLCETVDSSHFCVPICFLQTYSHKIKTYAVNVCVVWMPLFKKTLVAWSESFLSKKKVIPKSHLTRLVSQTASALNAWHKIILNTQASEIRGCPETLEIDDILVSESNGEPTFSISASMMKNRSKIDAAVKLKDSQYANLQYYPYLAPEQVSPTGYIIKKPTFDVWVIGMILFNVATGVPSLKAQVKKMADQAEKTARFNHPDISPETVVNTIRTEMEKSGYGPDLISLTALLLSVDYRCRPTLNIVENMMVELDRSNPIFRFPFSIGSYDLVRLPDYKDVEVNLSARKYVTKDLCVLCNEVRKLVKCTHGDGTHTPAITSASWASDEPLPGFIRPSCAMSYLYPLVPPLEDKEKRRLTSTGLGAETENSVHGFRASGFHNPNDKMDIAQLFQLFGGFAVHEKESGDSKRAVIKEILIPFPSQSLRKNESNLSVGTVHFTGAYPWVSACTKSLQKRAALCKTVPFNFVGTNHSVQWFAWISPGEAFTLTNGKKWVPAPEGGFVFLFNESLEPSEMDRYFTLTSMRALTNKYKMENTALVDKVFKRHVEAGETSTSRSGGLNRSFGGNTSRSGILENDDSPQRTRRKRSVMNTSAVDIPTTDQEIVEAETTVAPRRHTTSGEPTYKQSNGKSSGRPTSSNKQRRSTSHLIDMIPDHKVAPQSNSTSDRTTIREAKDGRKISSAQKPQSLSPMMTNDTNSFRPMSLGIQDDLVNLSPATAYTTPPTTVPRLPSINGGKVKLPTLYVFGKLYPSTVIDAVFQALTFWIPQSGEHGKMQESIPLSKGAKAALRAPKDATYMTFISSEVPLYARNHANCHFALSHLVVPHHGFVFYNDNEQPVGLLALTCSTKISRPRAGEFRIPLQAMTPTTIPPNEILNYYLSYISDDILPSETSNSTSTTFLSSDLFHTQSMLGKGNSIASKRNSTTASDAFKLSNTGESNLCWLGFDIANCTLMFSNLFQEVWYPFAFN